MGLKLKKTSLYILLVILFTFSCAAYANPVNSVELTAGSIIPPLAGQSDIIIDASSAMLVDAEGGQILYSSNPDKALHISAACKIMTILIGIENGKLNSNVTISKESVEAEGSALNLEVGEKYTLEQLLSAIQLSSANDAAKAVAEHISGDTESFVSLMNEKAKELKMNSTHFTNPTGLYNEFQYTTAEDIALMMRYALQNPEFKRIFGLQVMPWTHEDGRTDILASPNKLFWSYEGVDGGKTGYNVKELPSLIATATSSNVTYICILLDSPEEKLFTEAVKLFDYGFSNFRKGLLVSSGDALTSINVENTEINLIAAKNVFYIHPIGDSYIKDLEFSFDDSLPIKTTKIAAIASYVLSDGTNIDVPLYPQRELTLVKEKVSTNVFKALSANKDIMLLLYFLISIEVVILLIKIIRFILKLYSRRKKK